MLKLTDLGAEAVLESYFNKTQPAGGNNLTMKLYVNDLTPADDDVVGDYTEAASGGYAAKTLTAGSFTVSIAAGIPQAAYAEQTWTFSGALTGGATIYGYYVVDADNVLVYAERAAALLTPAAGGAELSITPVFQLSFGTPA